MRDARKYRRVVEILNGHVGAWFTQETVAARLGDGTTPKQAQAILSALVALEYITREKKDVVAQMPVRGVPPTVGRFLYRVVVPVDVSRISTVGREMLTGRRVSKDQPDIFEEPRRRRAKKAETVS